MNQPLLPFRRALALPAFALALLFSVLGSPSSAAEAKKSFDLPAGAAAETLKKFAAQAGREIVFAPDAVNGAQTKALKGDLTPQEALDRLLADTGLTASQDAKTGAFAVKRDAGPNAERAAQTDSDRPGQKLKVEDGVVKMDAFEVFGAKSINLDIRRTRDDAQPYVVFDHEQIAKSQATSLQDFFRTRLPMISTIGLPSYSQFSVFSTGVNLRGLGTNQTLILLDGRRLPSQGVAGTIASATPPNINGIPLAMIERIEVLPSTASGIYGGSATGGVINIITRKDFSGAVLSLTYANTFDTDSARRKVELNSSTSLRHGATVLTLSASYESSNAILTQDRDFALRSRQLQFANNPTAFTGASSPPRGYTTNIRNQTAANLVLKPQYGGTVLGSRITFVPVGYTGVASDNAAGLVANAGRYNLDLTDDPEGRRSALVTTGSPIASLGLGLRQKITPWLEGYVDYQWVRQRSLSAFLNLSTATTLPATAPNNPFTTAVVVSYPLPNALTQNYLENTTNRLTGGLVAKLPGEWQAGLDYTWGASKTFNRSNDGTVLGDPDGPTGPGISFNTSVSTGVNDVMRDLNRLPLDLLTYQMPNAASDIVVEPVTQSAALRASGPALRLPTGEVKVSGSVEWQEDLYPASVVRSVGSTTPVPTYNWAPEVSGSTRAAYVEARVPLLGPPSAESKQARLELQLAGRYDAARVNGVDSSAATLAITGPDGPFPVVNRVTRDYSDTSFTAGLRYVPLPDVTLRASFGTGFLAPSVNQLLPNSLLFANWGFDTAIDPKRGSVLATVGPYDWWVGGNPNVKPEHSESISGGVIFTPRFLPGFRLSIDYTKITKTDEITTLTIQQALANEDSLPGMIVRAPLTAADQALGYTGGVVTRANLTSVNIARREVEAVDVQADYTRKTTLGDFRAYAVATVNRRLASQVVPSAPLIDQVGYSNGPLKWRGNAGLDWSRGRWSAGWNVQYYDAQYIYPFGSTAASIASQVLNQGSDRFPVQFYHEAQVGYDFPHETTGWRRMFSDVQLLVGVQNVFNKELPLRAGTSQRTGYQAIEDPRLRRYTINLKKRF